LALRTPQTCGGNLLLATRHADLRVTVMVSKRNGCDARA
jgi:hypothetical protein